MPFSPATLRLIRIDRGLSREQLGLKVDRGYFAVRSWETGGAVPKTESLERLAAALDVGVNALFVSPDDGTERGPVEVPEVGR